MLFGGVSLQNKIKNAKILNVIGYNIYIKGYLPGSKNNLLTLLINNFKKR
jgi:hypothetical protein